MAEGGFVQLGRVGPLLFCAGCGCARLGSVRDCRLCEALASNLVLREEVQEVRRVLQEEREEWARVRGEQSVRPKDRTGEARSVVDTGGEQGWKLVGKGRAPSPTCVGRDRTPLGVVECSNKFGLLATMEEEEEVVIELGRVEGDETPKATVVQRKAGREGRKDRKRVEGSQEVLVMGDSRIRYLDSTFCEVDRSRRMTCCLPGAGVKDVAERYRRVVEGTGKEAVVVVHVGVNDIGRVGSVELVARYRELLRQIRQCGRRCIVSGVLPRQRVGGQWLSHALCLNDRLKSMCEESGVEFMDEWSRFYGRQELYAIDGVHFSRKGVQALSECLERVVRQVGQGN